MAESETTPQFQYLSSFPHGVDEKRRVQIPAKWRAEAKSSQFTLMVWPKHKAGTCLRMLPEHEFAKMIADIEALPKGDPNKDALRRFVGRESVQVTLDGAGRVVLPEEFARAADIKDQALFVGCVKHFEIWNPDRHENVKVVDAVITPQALGFLD